MNTDKNKREKLETEIVKIVTTKGIKAKGTIDMLIDLIQETTNSTLDDCLSVLEGLKKKDLDGWWESVIATCINRTLEEAQEKIRKMKHGK